MRADPVLVVERLYSEVYNQPDLAIAKQAASSILLNPARVVTEYTALRNAFPDWTVTRDLTLHSGNYVIVRWTGRGTQTGTFVLPQVTIPPTGVSVQVLGISIFHVFRGQIDSGVWGTDGLFMLSQLGVQFMPPSPPTPASGSPPTGSPQPSSPQSRRRPRGRRGT